MPRQIQKVVGVFYVLFSEKLRSYALSQLGEISRLRF